MGEQRFTAGLGFEQAQGSQTQSIVLAVAATRRELLARGIGRTLPVAMLATTLPISVGGLGVRERAAITLFGLVGVSAPNALALSVLLGLASIIISIEGTLLRLRVDRLSADDFDPTLDEGANRA